MFYLYLYIGFSVVIALGFTVLFKLINIESRQPFSVYAWCFLSLFFLWPLYFIAFYIKKQ
jgi:hypothetical protein